MQKEGRLSRLFARSSQALLATTTLSRKFRNSSSQGWPGTHTRGKSNLSHRFPRQGAARLCAGFSRPRSLASQLATQARSKNIESGNIEQSQLFEINYLDLVGIFDSGFWHYPCSEKGTQ